MNFTTRRNSPLFGRTVLQIIPDLDAGGAERTTVDIAEGLAEAGARALVATTGGRLVAELQAKGGEWVEFPAATKNPLAMAVNIGRLRRLIKDEKIDLVHARSRAPAWVAMAACKLTGAGFITTYHGAYSGNSAPKLLYNSVMARGEVVIANSHYTAKMIQTQFRIEPQRLRVIHRGTDFAKFSASLIAPERVEKVRRSWMVAPEDRIVLLAGRLTPWKGQKVLIEAARLLKAEGMARDLVFVLAGDPQGREAYVAEIDGLIASAGLSGTVRRVGHVTDMPAAMAAAAIAVVPSTAPEAFGRVAVEAQAMGTPVIVSNLGAVPETVLAPPQVRPDQRTGWRVEPDNPADLARAIDEALAMRSSAAAIMAERARRHVEEHFSLANMVHQTLDCYIALLEDKRGR